MTDDFLMVDVPWDDESQLVDDSEPAGGKHHFAHLRLYIANVTKAWEAGKYFTIPGVTGGQFNDKDASGNMMFKSYIKGGNDKLFIFVATKEDRNGQPYQIVKQLPNRRYRKGDKLPVHDIVLPNLKKDLTNAQRNKLVKEGLWMEWDEVPTGDTFKNDEGDEFEVMTWGANFRAFESKEAMKKAEQEFFSQFTGGVGEGKTAVDYPESWKSDVEGMINYVKQLNSEGKSHKEIAKTVMLEGEDNAKAILSSILDVPEPMIEL